MSAKLHPVYVALDSHQYSRAIKLASALPPSNILGRALLAHAYWKNGQSIVALETIHASLGWDLQQEPPQDVLDLMEADSAPIDWNTLPTNACPPNLGDETTLETFSVTLEGMKRADLIFKLYGWVGQQNSGLRLYTLPKQYMAGLHVLSSSKRNDSILASMQAIAFQLSRMVPVYTAWAARTALWQWQFTRNTNADDIRIQMLPRLAESLAKKALELDGSSIEDCLLLIEVLEAQEKWDVLLETLPQLKKLPSIQCQETEAKCYRKLQRWSEAKDTFVQLTDQHPDQWAHWKSLIEAAVRNEGHDEAQKVVQELISRYGDAEKPSRSILLASCELARAGLQHGKTLEDLTATMKEYSEAFCARASCTFADIEGLLEQVLREGQSPLIDSVFQWADGLRISNSQENGEDDRSKLRSYIFAVQVLQRIAKDDSNQHRGTDWKILAKAWIDFPAKQGAQKENQPSDEIVLLAVENMLNSEAAAQDLIAAVTLLEMALKRSPFNPYIKLRLMDLYGKLHGYDRCWALFRDLGVKHIQCDSISYVILPLCLKGGLYNKALIVANEILKFHNSTLRDSGEYTNRAMENGTWSKADEFVKFQRDHLNNSLALLEAKGVTMDTAPLMIGSEVGSAYGIVGKETDMERAQQMLDELSYANGAPSLLMLKDFGRISDNRDFSILPTDSTSVVPKEQIVAETKRRIFFHGLLVRLATITTVAKGPKKGKVAKRSEPLLGRCKNVLSFLSRQPDSGDCWMSAAGLLAEVAVVLNSGLPETGEADTLKTREERVTALISKATDYLKGLPTEWEPEVVGKLIPDSLVSTFAIFRMTATLFALFGWGKRKQREIVGTLADFALTLRSRLDLMLASFDAFPGLPFDFPEHYDVLDRNEWAGVCRKIEHSRGMMQTRIGNILTVIIEELGTFEQSP